MSKHVMGTLVQALGCINNCKMSIQRNVYDRTLSIVTAKWFFVCLLALGGLYRVYQVFQIPLYTTDTLRNVGHGLGFLTWGFRVYDLTAFDFSPLDSQFMWPNHHYFYPAVTLLFFAGISKIWASIFFAKVMLTVLDAVSTWLIFKTSEDRWTALLFWLNPISLWFSAREGQFEGLVIFLSVLALYGIKRHRVWAFGILGLAVQAKIFPIFLVPYFLIRLSWKNPRRLALEWGLGLLSFLPSLWAQYQSDYIFRLFDMSYVPLYCPISWTLGDASHYPYTPYWIVLLHWIMGVVFLCMILLGIKKTNAFWDFFPAMAFLLFVKSIKLGQFWYLMLLPAFCLPIENTRWRRILFVLAALMGIKSIYSIFVGAVGYRNSADVLYVLQQNFWGM
jgi:hypothetical protein